jgi:hypothetical protein
MKKTFFYLIIQLIVIAGISQSSIKMSGTVSDSAAGPIRNATVRLLNTNWEQ